TLALGRRERNPFLGRDYTDERNYSEEIARMIDEESRAIVDRSYQRASDLLTTHRDKLDRVVRALLERETLTREEFLAVMAGEELPPQVIRDESGSMIEEKPVAREEKQPKPQ